MKKIRVQFNRLDPGFFGGSDAVPSSLDDWIRIRFSWIRKPGSKGGNPFPFPPKKTISPNIYWHLYQSCISNIQIGRSTERWVGRVR